LESFVGGVSQVIRVLLLHLFDWQKRLVQRNWLYSLLNFLRLARRGRKYCISRYRAVFLMESCNQAGVIVGVMR
jgi:hypothetical protein